MQCSMVLLSFLKLVKNLEACDGDIGTVLKLQSI